jgi:hypothetical protein
MGNLLGVTYLVIVYIALPCLMIWGWMRWSRRKKPENLVSAFSLASLLLATASALLAVLSIAYSMRTGGFAFYAPVLLRIFRWGLYLSAGGLLSGLVGVWRSSPLRWHAPACSFGMILFWLASAAME